MFGLDRPKTTQPTKSRIPVARGIDDDEVNMAYRSISSILLNSTGKYFREGRKRRDDK